jgi:hypothetical protein
MRGPVSKNVVRDEIPSGGKGNSGPTLPWHPQIEEGEDFSFWLHRLAAGYGLSKAEFCKVIPGIDQDPIFAAASTGIPANRLIDGTIESLAALVPWKSLGAGYNSAVSTPAFVGGLSFSYRMMVFNFLADVSQDTHLTGGYTINGNLYGASAPTTTTYYSVKFAPGISIRIPLNGTSQ